MVAEAWDGGATLKLSVYDEAGGLVSEGIISDKGVSKSREQGALWLLHATTGRLLPWDQPHRLLEITTAADGTVCARVAPLPGQSLQREVCVLAGHSCGTGAGQVAVEEKTVSSDLLRSLEELLRERRRTRPEGSYTTHLFEKGIDKIRKKTGEEAVELILAREPAEIVHESADLIYHLLVLLVEQDIGIEPVLEELNRRLNKK